MKKLHKIKFSHDYDKLPRVWEGTQAILFGVVYVDSMIDLQNRLPELIKKDTKFRGEEGSYRFPLSMDSALILTFYHVNTGTLFTTIRSYNEEKDEYYRSQIGETFLMERSK